MDTFAITLLGANGQLHSFSVPPTILAMVYQTLMESEHCSLIQPLPVNNSPEPVQPEPDETFRIPHISRGTRPGYCELYFPGKPEKTQRTELKSLGFRYSNRGGQPHWFGQCSRLPKEYNAPNFEDSYTHVEPADIEPQQVEPEKPAPQTDPTKPVNLIDLVNQYI